MLKELIEQHAATNGFYFIYGDKATHNLLGCVESLQGRKGLFLEPIQSDQKFGQFGGLESETYRGHFVLVVKSELDGGSPETGGQDYYLQKYENNIKPAKENATVLGTEIACAELEINEWSIVELINFFDENTDGVSVKFTIKRTI